jgi:hypothetical protein
VVWWRATSWGCMLRRCPNVEKWKTANAHYTCFLSNQCGLSFGVTCCYHVLPTLSGFFYQVSCIIFTGVHTNYTKHDI